MDPTKTYRYLVKARGLMLDWARPLTPQQHNQVFPIGLGTLGKTLAHIAMCEWLYVHRMERLPFPPKAQWPIDDEHPPAPSDLQAWWTAQADRTTAAIARINDWHTPYSYQADWEGQKQLVTASPADIFTQLVCHEVHHRAQALNMIKQLGCPVSDIDYNALMYVRVNI